MAAYLLYRLLWNSLEYDLSSLLLNRNSGIFVLSRNNKAVTGPPLREVPHHIGFSHTINCIVAAILWCKLIPQESKN